ncbi:MAG: YbgC/FadM family acyl-CoA thioesterase [Fibrobacterota bacterium]
MKIRIYYEDTDCGGVVYHSNYLRYMERARTEFLRERNINLQEYHKKGTVFAVTEAHLKYRSPATYDDLLTVSTEVTEVTTYRTVFHNTIRNQEGRLCCTGEIKLVAVNSDTMKVTAADEDYIQLMKQEISPNSKRKKK